MHVQHPRHHNAEAEATRLWRVPHQKNAASAASAASAGLHATAIAYD